MTSPLASAEGFVRQVLGWREYMWHLYWHFGPGYLRRNALRAHAPLPDWWTSLDADAVTAACLRAALEGVRDRGWTHHIPRLMVLGNHALQRGYQPRALSDWFREAFVDGFEWVMPTNVIGMSQHADGGLLATKPYASGGAYINRMSDHCGDCAFDPRKRLGDDACPFTAGYWAWVHRHRELLAANNRTRDVRRCAGSDLSGAGAGVGAGRSATPCWSSAGRPRASAFVTVRVCRTGLDYWRERVSRAAPWLLDLGRARRARPRPRPPVWLVSGVLKAIDPDGTVRRRPRLRRAAEGGASPSSPACCRGWRSPSGCSCSPASRPARRPSPRRGCCWCSSRA